MTLGSGDIGAAWDREYYEGRYVGDPPVQFAHDIATAAARLAGETALYIGCGNGRNLPPLLDAGLDVLALDVSEKAIEGARERFPGQAERFVHGDLSAIPPGQFDLVVGIQVFQHGSRTQCHEHIRAAQERVARGGMIAVRVNAIGTDIEYDHEPVEPATAPGDGFTIRYEQGPKTGLLVHFFGERELDDLFAGFVPISPLQRDQTWRDAPGAGQWSQWEGIWLKPADSN